jgi:hypothetical protein
MAYAAEPASTGTASGQLPIPALEEPKAELAGDRAGAGNLPPEVWMLVVPLQVERHRRVRMMANATEVGEAHPDVGVELDAAEVLLDLGEARFQRAPAPPGSAWWSSTSCRCQKENR